MIRSTSRPSPPPHSASAQVSTGVFGASDLYDRAFSYRDYEAEVEWLVRHARRTLGRAPRSCLELAAGPAHHAIALAKREVAAIALDLSPEMGTQAMAAAAAADVEITAITGDMRAFTLPHPVDLAFTLINSLSHVHTLDDLIAHLQCVAAHLTPQGAYVIEMQHPRDFVGRGARTTGVSAPWTIEDAEGTLTARWGRSDDPYDFVGQRFSAHVHLAAEGPGGTETLDDVVVMRDWTRDEIVAAGRLAGLSQVEFFGDFDPEVAFDNAETAWRMVAVFTAPNVST